MLTGPRSIHVTSRRSGRTAVSTALALWAVLPVMADNRPAGLLLKKPGACPGYTLIAPMQSTRTHLVNLHGQIVHTWKSEYPPGQSAYLLDNGDLLRTARPDETHGFGGGGLGGRLERFNWDGQLVWSYDFVSERHCQHHDIEPMPNGNILVIAWERKSADEAIAAGRKPDLIVQGEIWPDKVVEIKPMGKDDAEVVWEWHVWDHVVQDFDKTKANYGDVAAHPERIDLNFGGRPLDIPLPQLERLRQLGYVDGPDEKEDRDQKRQRRGPPGQSDWTHINSVDYDAELDLIVLSVHTFNEVWVIDHSTTTADAARSTGGRHGHGGDLLYRWGNPAAYRAGTRRDQKLFAQHDARWLRGVDERDVRLLVYNNGIGRPGTPYSSVDEMKLPLRADGTFDPGWRKKPRPFKPVWSYDGRPAEPFFSGHVSGAQRLPNGNTLICAGEPGMLIEVTPAGERVWVFDNPYGGDVELRSPPDRRHMRRGNRPPPGRPEGPPPGGGPRGVRPPRGGGPGHHGPRDKGALFRALRIPTDHPAIEDRL